MAKETKSAEPEPEPTQDDVQAAIEAHNAETAKKQAPPPAEPAAK